MRLSAKTGDGMADWLAWLSGEVESYRLLREARKTLVPRVQSEGRSLHAGSGPEIVFKPVGFTSPAA
jgi:hypothetical protein